MTATKTSREDKTVTRLETKYSVMCISEFRRVEASQDREVRNWFRYKYIHILIYIKK